MSDWREKSNELKERLRLRTEPVAYRRLERVADLDSIDGVTPGGHRDAHFARFHSLQGSPGIL